ncbi:MAG: type II toxin-antitoxin system PemK/MazF family toxin [Acidimicrobiia bacterium]
MQQGDVYWGKAVNKRRPVLVVSRSTAIPILNRLVVAPITTTIRDIPQEIVVSESVGLRVDCVASMDNLFAIPKAMLEGRVGAIPDARQQICRALEALADC